MLSCNFFNDKISTWKYWLPTLYLTYTSHMSRTSTRQRLCRVLVLHSTRQQLINLIQKRQLCVRPIDWLYTLNWKFHFRKWEQQYLPLDVCTKREKHVFTQWVVQGAPCLTYISIPRLTQKLLPFGPGIQSRVWYWYWNPNCHYIPDMSGTVVVVVSGFHCE